MSSVSLKMINSGIVYTHDGNGKVTKAVRAGWAERLVLSKLNQRLK